VDCTDGVDGVLMGRAVGCCLVGCREGKRDSNWSWLLAVIRPGSWGNGRETDRLTTMTTTKKTTQRCTGNRCGFTAKKMSGLTA
jgi:hypothetical protein